MQTYATIYESDSDIAIISLSSINFGLIPGLKSGDSSVVTRWTVDQEIVG